MMKKHKKIPDSVKSAVGSSDPRDGQEMIKYIGEEIDIHDWRLIKPMTEMNKTLSEKNARFFTGQKRITLATV